MDAVETFLLGVVGLSVFVILILDNRDTRRDSKETLKQSGGFFVSEIKGRDQSVGGGAGGSGYDEKGVASENQERGCIQETEDRKETDNLVNASCGIPDFSGDICRERGNDEVEYIDDWEEIERSQLEKLFSEAIVFTNCRSNDNRIGEDVKLQLYGLERVVVEGPCHGSHPMALQVSARSKWKAWQKLGNMSEEVAMENYIAVLSEAIPEWNLDVNLRSKVEDTLIKGDRTTSEDLKLISHENIQGSQSCS